MKTMDIYKINDRRRRFHSPGFQGYFGKERQRQYSFTRQSFAGNLRHSATVSNPSFPVMTVPEAIRVYEDYHGCFALESDVPTVLRSINESKMAAITRQALQRNNFCIQGWRARKIESGAGNPVSLDLYRFEGIGVDRNEWLDWSIILKVIQSPGNLGYDNCGGGR